MSSSEDKRSILIPIDSSEHSRRAFDCFIEDVAKPGDVVQLLHILEPKISTVGYNIAAQSVTDMLDKTMDDSLKTSKRLGQQYIDLLSHQGYKGNFLIHVGNKPGEHIVSVSKEYDIDLIIIGNRGVGTMKRKMLGSVSDYVLHNANRPVMVVPPVKEK